MEEKNEFAISNGIKIINASTIESWTIKDRRFFEGIFPEIIKKIIIESTEGKIQNLRLPSGDNIWIPGVDGQLVNLNDNKWLGSKGKVILEIGTTQKQSWTKIKKDFKKRNIEISDKEKQETTFIIFSSKILIPKEKEKFCQENKGEWLDLRIYDALDLENWLEECLNTTLYFYEKMEGKKLNYSSLEYAWTNFKKQTNPELSTSFLTIGRKDNVERLKNYIENRNSSNIAIKSLSQTESYGFVLSVLFEYYQNNNFIIVINDISTFEEITKKVSNKIFILNFYLEQCIFPSNNYCIVLFGNNSANRYYDINLIVRSFSTILKSLKNDMSIPYDKIITLDRKCGNNVMAIMREIRSTSFLSQPNWIVREDLNNLIPLLFLGQIDQNNEKDRSILQTILGNESVVDYFKKILIWQKIDDSPIMFYDTIIKVNAVEELWNELSNQFTIDDFKNLIRLIEQIFSEDINKINIGTMNSIFKPYEYYSEYIYDGLLSSLILFSIKDNSKQYQIDQIVEQILNMIKNIDQLKYISKYFGLLSEVSPERFIDFLEKKISSQKELIIDFLTPKKDTFIFGDNQYTNLLHSLTTLTELKKYNIKACNFLVQLYLLNIKYSLTNSPQSSLINSLSFLNKENAFTFQEKISFLLHLIEQYKENIFELCIKIVTNDGITLTYSSLKWRNPDISEYKLTCQEIDSGINKIIKNLLDNLNAKETEMYCKILGHYVKLPKESMNELKKYAEKNFQTDEEKKFVYYYIIHELKNIKQFKEEEKYQKIIDFFEQLLVIVSPEDQFVKNLIYFNDFNPYILEMNNKTIIQLKELFNDMKNKYDNLVEKISTALNDQRVSGYILSEILSFEEINLAFDFLLETQKFNTLISLLEIRYNELDTIDYLRSISRENLEKIIKLFGINNIVNFNKKILQDNNLLRLYWENRSIFNKSSLEEIKQIKKFNSLGYLQYLDRHIDFKLWNISEILELLKNLTEEDLKKQIHLYYLEDILYKINDNFYNDVVISVSSKFYFLCKREKMFKSIRRFLLENPIEFIKIILKTTSANSVGFNIRWNYYFPDDFEKKPELLENFADVFYNYQLDDKKEKKYILNILGEILARSTKYSSNLFIPNCLRKIIEKYKSKDIRLGFALGHYNAIGVRSLDDGTVDLNLSKKYEAKAQEIEIEFPETAKIFYDISKHYKYSSNERKQEDLIGF